MKVALLSVVSQGILVRRAPKQVNDCASQRFHETGVCDVEQCGREVPTSKFVGPIEACFDSFFGKWMRL